ncbi:hypothetical protein Tco_1125894 [Tanacetum coccineum]
MDDLIRNRNAFQQEIDTIKETLSNNVKEKESLSKTLTVFKTESKEKESKYIDKEIVLEKQNKELENIICKIVIAKEHAVISVINDEETLILDEESRSKMFDKQNDPISIEKKIKISLTDYSKLNKIKEDFAPSELSKVSLVNESLKKLKYQLANFDKVVKNKTTFDDITAGAWEAVVDQRFVDKNNLEIKIKQLSIDNDQLLNQTMSQDIVHIAMNFVDILDVTKSCVDECNKCLELENELLKKKDFIEKKAYDKLFKSYSTLECTTSDSPIRGVGIDQRNKDETWCFLVRENKEGERQMCVLLER